MTTPALLSLTEVSLSFKGVSALTKLSFAIEEGHISALIGPNGAGKSSALNLINGVYRPTSGSILFAGRSLESVQPRQAAALGIGRTFQHNALFKHMRVIDNVMVGLSRLDRSGLLSHAFRLPLGRREERRMREQAEAALALLHIGPYREFEAGSLPYGIQKRIDLARALVAEPKLLLLDEPMAGMNHDEKREMSDLIRRVSQTRGTTILMIEHDVGIVMELCDHVVVLDYGRKVGDGTPDAVRNDPAVLAAYLGTTH